MGKDSRVKPLDWGDGNVDIANVPFGSYSVLTMDGFVKWSYCFDEYCNEGGGEERTIEAAKEAAQQHWNEIVEECLLPIEDTEHVSALNEDQKELIYFLEKLTALPKKDIIECAFEIGVTTLVYAKRGEMDLYANKVQEVFTKNQHIDKLAEMMVLGYDSGEEVVNNM